MGLFFNNQDIANAGVTEKAVLYSRSRFSCEPSEIGAAKPDGARLLREAPAAFRRLCVETVNELPKRRNLIAVGIAHLPDENGLIMQLRRQGYTVVPVAE